MDPLQIDEPGRKVLLMGNEAIARGAIEAGLHFCAAYPGSPSSEIMAALSRVAPHFGHYTEWSTNEKVALEGACGAAYTGLRAMATMKQNGVNVASDILTAMALAGNPGGLVLVVCDDPGGISSTNEVDTRNYARLADVPLLEPSTFQEAKDMVRWAFSLSEELELLCMVRSVTRISHARGVVELGTIEKLERTPVMKPEQRYGSLPPCPNHAEVKAKLRRAGEIFETSPFNKYAGPERPELLVVTCGTGWWYSTEAIQMLGVADRVGVLKLGTTWPLPEALLKKHLEKASSVLVIEESDPVLEYNLKALLSKEDLQAVAPSRVLGKVTGTVQGVYGPGVGEMNPNVVADAISRGTGTRSPLSAGELEIVDAAGDRFRDSEAGGGLLPRLSAPGLLLGHEERAPPGRKGRAADRRHRMLHPRVRPNRLLHVPHHALHGLCHRVLLGHGQAGRGSGSPSPRLPWSGTPRSFTPACPGS